MTDERSAYEEYQICKERGHGPSSMQTASLPPWHICDRCGTYWRYERKMVEMRIPDKDGTPNWDNKSETELRD
jgi:hypothetical protein